MESPGAIKHANVFQHTLLRFISSPVVLPLHLLLLQTAKEALNNIPKALRRIGSPSNCSCGSYCLESREQSPKCFAGILRTPVRMMNQPCLGASVARWPFSTHHKQAGPSCVNPYPSQPLDVSTDQSPLPDTTSPLVSR